MMLWQYHLVGFWVPFAVHWVVDVDNERMLDLAVQICTTAERPNSVLVVGGNLNEQNWHNT